ncbi:hypothetical protein OH802_00915 [Nocardioides sp. NBC_00850]|nr:hypothetical protein OH802_00915 [Nocardioides sp. NBC_00850]
MPSLTYVCEDGSRRTVRVIGAGAACAFTPQINDVLYGDKLYVEAQTGSP